MLTRPLKVDIRWYVVFAIMAMALLTLKDEGIIVVRHLVPICLISCITDFVIIALRDGKRTFPLSALVSWLIISSIMAPTQWFYIAPLAAILSKCFIRYSGRHIFNPAAFGLLAANVIFKVPLTWWLVTNVIVIIIFGLFFAYKIKKISLVASVICSTLIFSVLYSLMKHQPLFANTGILNFFFVFFMSLEPKTSPVSLRSKVLYGALIALFGFISLAFIPEYDFMVMSLIIANIGGVILRKVK